MSAQVTASRHIPLQTCSPLHCSLHLVHLSRWAEDLIIYSSGQFKFVQCSDAYATGVPTVASLRCQDGIQAACTRMLGKG